MDDRGSPAGVRGVDVLDREAGVADQGLGADQGLSADDGRARSADIVVGRAEAFFGAFGLLAVFALVTWGVIGYRGLGPETMGGVYAGVFAGLISLVIEIAVIGRSLRLFAHNGMGATLQTFTMRLVIVASLGIWFMRAESATDAQAFCLSYCGTFFVYLCWLTWRTYKAPVQYRAKSRTVTGAASSGPAAELATAGGVR